MIKFISLKVYTTILKSIETFFSKFVFVSLGSGESLEIAQEMAAREALKKFFETEDSMKALPFGRQLKAVQSKVVKLEHRPNVPLNEWSLAKVSSLAH